MNEIIEMSIHNEYLRVDLINYGASLRAIYFKDSAQNLLLNFNDITDYIKQPSPYLNAVVGPVAGRIAYGKYQQNGEVIQLSTDFEKNHLHGGQSGISKKFFDLEKVNPETIQCRLKTTHQQDGFKGIFNYFVQYQLVRNSLQIELKCIPSQQTILNMTNHLYFRLQKDSELKVEAQQIMALHPDGFPSHLVDVAPPYDYRQFRTIETDLNTPYLLDGKVWLKSIGTLIEIETDAETAVLYNATAFDNRLILNGGQRGYPKMGLAIECQDMPNGINVSTNLKDYLYSTTRPYHQKTCFTFTERMDRV